jgi:hypothetical protein
MRRSRSARSSDCARSSCGRSPVATWSSTTGPRSARSGTRLPAGGFSCPVIASPFLKTPPYQVDWGALERSFEVAHLVGAGMVRTFSWLRDGAGAESEKRLVEVLASAIERTAAAGLRLGLENEHACTVATGAEAARVLDALADEGFGLIWDPGNEARIGSTPYPDGYAQVRQRVAHVHVKDADGRDGGCASVRVRSTTAGSSPRLPRTATRAASRSRPTTSSAPTPATWPPPRFRPAAAIRCCGPGARSGVRPPSAARAPSE